MSNKSNRTEELVFTVGDDVSLFGDDALVTEFHTRRYDPYEVYKQRAAKQPVQPRMLKVIVSESA